MRQCRVIIKVVPKKSISKDIVYNIILNSSYPITPTEIKNKCKNFDRATIYRTLNNLKENHLIRMVEVGDGQLRYESSFDHHHHLICIKCRKTQRVDLSLSDEKRLKKMQNAFQTKFNFTSLEHSLEFFGLCSNCKKI